MDEFRGLIGADPAAAAAAVHSATSTAGGGKENTHDSTFHRRFFFFLLLLFLLFVRRGLYKGFVFDMENGASINSRVIHSTHNSARLLFS